jgi:hypothetical protein
VFVNKQELIKAAEPTGQSHVVQAAVAAGIPLGTILAWVFAHGPELAKVIFDLIKKFKEEPPAAPSATNP